MRYLNVVILIALLLLLYFVILHLKFNYGYVIYKCILYKKREFFHEIINVYLRNNLSILLKKFYSETYII